MTLTKHVISESESIFHLQIEFFFRVCLLAIHMTSKCSKLSACLMLIFSKIKILALNCAVGSHVCMYGQLNPIYISEYECICDLGYKQACSEVCFRFETFLAKLEHELFSTLFVDNFIHSLKILYKTIVHFRKRERERDRESKTHVEVNIFKYFQI
jgi:hypothetical protein